jgi:hypothetical protein
MDTPTRPGTAIAHDDLVVLTEAVMARLPLRGAEAQRVERMQALLDAAAELTGALAAHTHCARVHLRGTHGIGDLAAETETLVVALERYARLVREVGLEYGRLVRTPVMPLELLPMTSEPGGLVA